MPQQVNIVAKDTFTQTYSTASGTVADITTTTITNNSGGTASGTIADLGTAATAQPPQAWNNAIATLATQVNALQVDVLAAKKVQNQIIDSLQKIGLVG